MTLKEICKYYISCIALENSTTIRTYFNDNKSFTEIPHISNDALKISNIEAFLYSNYEKEKDLLIGYPILKHKNSISPLFIIPISFNSGRHNNIPTGFSIDDEILINKDIIDKYSANEKTENIFELRDLESELGFTNGYANISDLKEIVKCLTAIRPNWDWHDNLNYDTFQYGNLSPTLPDGILNRAILFARDPTPYTVGLCNELARLSELNVNDIRHSILWKFIHNKFNNSNNSYNKNLLEVLPLNEEQKKAIKSALTADVTLISGPPGTGKTQVVADLIINAAFAGKTVLFASKNNNAVDVVVKRVNALNDNSPLILRYEKNARESIAEYVQTWKKHSKRHANTHSALNAYNLAYKSFELKKLKKQEIVESRNKLNEIDHAIQSIRHKYAHLIGVLTDNNISIVEEAYENYLQSTNVLVWGPQTLKEKLFRTRWESDTRDEIKKDESIINNFLQSYHPELQINENLSNREKEHFDSIFRGLIADLKLISDYNYYLFKLRDNISLEELDYAMMSEHVSLQAKAKAAWLEWLNNHAKVFTPQSSASIQNYLSLIEHDNVDAFTYDLRELLPASAITALSARRRLPFKEAIYDLLIIDEASQCDIASMIPLLLRAKRVAIIGDNKQLNHICIINKQTDMSLLKTNNIEARWSYRNCSIYDLANGIVEAENLIQLRDHHRSFLDIIQFSNQEFYDNSLRIATDYSKLNAPYNGAPLLGMQWMDIKGQTIRPVTGGAYNLKEVEGVIRILKRLSLELHFEGSIGVTTPFHLQAEIIAKTLECDAELRNHLELHNQILIDTVHKFQGDEKDVIIFSPVVSNGASKQSLQFLESTGNLFNVAITRARALLVTVGNKEFCKQCNVSYLQHFAEYSVGENAPVEASEWEHILQRVLSNVGIPVTAQYHVDKYYLDLALFHNGKKLDIEVDGEMYHKSWSGELCYKDQLRNQALMRQGWSVMRFWVQQVRDQLPWCVEQIQKWIRANS